MLHPVCESLEWQTFSNSIHVVSSVGRGLQGNLIRAHIRQGKDKANIVVKVGGADWLHKKKEE